MTSVKSITTTTGEPPLSQSCCEQYMFLLELYICKIKSERLAKLNEMFCLPTSVEFSFLRYKKDNNLRISPVNHMFEPLSGVGEDDEDVEKFYSGKSVLFALDSGVVANTYVDFIIKLDVYKRFPKDIKPDVLVGQGEVDMSMPFAALRKEIIDNSKYHGADIPNPSKTFDGQAAMCYCGKECGTIDVYARISGYGQTLVTEFAAPRVDASISSFLFKTDDCDAKGPKYKCRVIDADVCGLSDTSSTGGKDCLVCKQPKLPCSPCRIGSGAIVATGRKDKCQKKEVAAMADVCAKSTCSPIQTSRGPKEPCGKAVVLKV